MPSNSLVVALDCGTSATKAIVVDATGRVTARESSPLGVSTPQPGWVEQDPWEVLRSAQDALSAVLTGTDAALVSALGISNQRESLVLWEKESGEPLSPVVSWQDRRTRSIVDALTSDGYGEQVFRTSGLPLDPMFSAVKATWLLDNYDPDRSRSRRGELALGTVDSWLAWNLTGAHVSEPGNASRMSLLDIRSATWSGALLEIFNVPRECLPSIGPSARDDLPIRTGPLLGVPLAGLIGDSHAALFAHAGWKSGTAKATLGTGSSVMVTTGDVPEDSRVCRTLAWQLPGQQPTAALEGNILAAGATLAWLADIFGTTPSALADEAANATEVVFVPAFDGLAAPWWDDHAIAVISQLSLATTRADLARSALDSVAMQIADVVSAFDGAGVTVPSLIVDGGMTENASLMASLANAIGKPIQVANAPDASAQGAADLAGLAVGLWSIEDLDQRPREYRVVDPTKSEEERRSTAERWKIAVERARNNGYDRSRQ